jgi:glycosyltransferase involved in cell wall biosynthesis
MSALKNAIKLTIAIPTFNGSATLGQCINSCLAAIENDGVGGVEILIVDNCSTDSTSAVSQTFVNQYQNTVRYIRNDLNIGLDRNIDVAIEKASGKYVKLLGDDDLLGLNFVSNLRNILEGDNLDIILSSFLLYSEKLQKIEGSDLKFKTYFKDPQIFLDSSGIIGQITSLTFKKESYQEILASDLNDTNHKFMYIASKLILSGASSYDMSNSLLVRPGSPRFTYKPLDSLNSQKNAIRTMQLILNFAHTLEYLDLKIIKNMMKSQKRYSLTFMDFVHRYTNLNSVEVIAEFFPIGKQLPVFYFKYIPIVLIPKKVGNLLVKLLKRSSNLS